MALSQTAIKIAVASTEPALFNEDVDLRHPVRGSQLTASLTEEIEQYFITGNSGQHQDSNSDKWINPTLLQPNTAKWAVHFACCPFYGYSPLPLKELDGSGACKGIAFAYCQAELKKLLIAFKKRQKNVTFHFHLHDPLVFCYQDSLLQFDIIDGSSFLADKVGLVNLVNAAAQKLRSDQSVLITDSCSWTFIAPDVSGYLQTALCCPLSLIPTIYGLRLIDSVELGPDTFISTRHSSRPFSRLRWKKAQPFQGVTLDMSPQLEQSLGRLKKYCFSIKVSSSDAVHFPYSPLTFHYVMCDLIRRGLPASVIESTFHPPSLFRKSWEAIQDWMEGRPLFWVNIRIRHLKEKQQELCASNYLKRCGNIPLRLVLVPNNKGLEAACEDPDRFSELLTSSDCHYIDNLEVETTLKTDGSIDGADISFFLADRNLLMTHCGIVVDRYCRMLIFGVDSKGRAERFKMGEESNSATSSGSSSSDSSKQLVTISCQESQVAYTLRIKFPPDGNKLPRSGIQNDRILDSVFHFLIIFYSYF